MKIAAVGLILCCSTLAAAITVPEYYARRDYPSAGGYVALGDVNGDGIPDIVAAAEEATVSAMLGNGHGTFAAAVNTAVQWESMRSAALVDLNGDGKMDLIVSGGPFNGGGGIGVLFSNGDGTFQAPVFYPVNDGTLGAVVGDFNGDGIPDVAAPGGKGIWLFAGRVGGTFNPGVLTPTASASNSLGAADFNLDSKLDLAVSTSSGVYLLLGNGDGTFQTPAFVGGSGGVVAAGPVTRDGYPDILVSGASIYLNNGKGGFLGPVKTTLTGQADAIGDVNGDGIPDLVSSQGCVALGLGDAKFAPQKCYPIANTAQTLSVVLAELTKAKPGFNDIIAGLNRSVTVLQNLGNGTFVDGEWISVPGAGACGAGADFNGDGKPDLALPTTNGLVMLLGTGKASAPYSAGTTIPLSGPGCPITADVNGDGIPDLLEGANSLGGVGVYLGSGDGTFVLETVIPLGVASNIVVGDFNHDGKLDVATSSNEFALGNGDGTFQTPVPILANPPDLGFSWVVAGDVNNDGWTDLLATQPSYCCGALYILLNNQQGGFTLTTISDSDAPTSVMLADLNGDGNLDAVVQEDAVAVAHVYLGNGKGGFVSGQNGIHYPFVDDLPAQIADVNGDGIPDLLLPADGSIAIALGTGKGTFYNPFTVGVGPNIGQVFAQNLHGQPKSGLPDLVAPDSDGGVMVLININK